MLTLDFVQKLYKKRLDSEFWIKLKKEMDDFENENACFPSTFVTSTQHKAIE